MKLTVDTNVLVRAVMKDDPTQARKAVKHLQSAELVAVTLPSLCEFVWVLIKVYGVSPANIARAIRALIMSANVETNRPAVEAGLAALESGGDFADGVIAFEGSWLGGDTFVSFDKKAVQILLSNDRAAQLL